MAKVKPKWLESYLQDLKTFDGPTVGLEQYQTPPHIAAHVLWAIDTHYGGISGKTVLDLGCGCGVLGIGCAHLGAKRVVGVDIDQHALDIALENVTELNLPGEVISFIHKDIRELTKADLGQLKFNIAIMNPPFGTRDQVGIDAIFVEKALLLADTVFSMHKSQTRKFWLEKQAEWNMKAEPLLQIQFNLDHTYKFHKEATHNIDVDLVQFTSVCK